MDYLSRHPTPYSAAWLVITAGVPLGHGCFLKLVSGRYQFLSILCFVVGVVSMEMWVVDVKADAGVPRGNGLLANSSRARAGAHAYTSVLGWVVVWPSSVAVH